MFQWFRKIREAVQRESSIPAPRFKASKRTARIMYGLWYGRLTPLEARQQAREWGFSDESIDRIIAESTVPPSYWSQHQVNEE